MGTQPGSRFWRQVGYAFVGKWEIIAYSNAPSAAACGPVCTSMKNPKECNAFRFNEGVCTLVRLESQGLCSLAVSPGCVDDGGLLAHDTDDVFCADNSVNCWCSSDYRGCMEAFDCLTSAEASRLGAECEEKFCSHKQCGLEAAVSVQIPACAQRFDACLAWEGGKGVCRCTHQYIQCTGVASDWEHYQNEDAAGILRQCLSEGCSKSDCGLPADYCVEDMVVRCSSDYMVCDSEGRSASKWARPPWASSRSDHTITDGQMTWLRFPAAMPVVATTKGLGSGKRYWELEMTPGTCVVAGVRAVNNEDPHNVFIPEYEGAYELQGFGAAYGHDLQIQGWALMVVGAQPNVLYPTIIGPQESGPIRLGFALDASSERLWISRDGVWLKGNPSTGVDGTALPKLSKHRLWHPAAARVCGAGSMTAEIFLSAEDYRYDPPQGFAPFTSSVCDCSRAYQQCSEEAGCVEATIAGRIYEECISNGCDAAQCGISVKELSLKDSRGCGPELHSMCASRFWACSEAQCGASCDESDDCGIGLVCKNVDSFHELSLGEPCPFSRCRCSLPTGGSLPPSCGGPKVEEGGTSSGCECGRQMLECLGGCELDEAAVVEYTEICGAMGCTPQECGMCSAACNQTQVACWRAFNLCDDAASMAQRLDPSFNQRCECAADFYACMASGACITHGMTLEHRDLCRQMGCSGEDCGIPADILAVLPENRTCISSDLLCTRTYMECTAQRMDPAKDRCAINFVGRTGEIACSNPRYLGIAGCNYDAETDTCYTSEECGCSGEYFACMSRHDCIDDQSLATFTDLCAQRGCTSEQCGLGPYTCNRTALVCANGYLQCALEQVEEGNSLDYESVYYENFFCEASFCLRRYFSCMSRARCTSPADLMTHIRICEDAGCTLEECGVNFEEESMHLPDEPRSILAKSTLDRSFRVTWQHSSLARQWIKTGSINMVHTYSALFEGGCVLGDACADLLASNESDALGLRQLTYDGGQFSLAVGTLYKVSISATNAMGTGPSASKFQRLAGIPGQPQGVAASRGASALTVLIQWSPPSDSGDTTPDGVVIKHYIIEITASPSARPIEFNVSKTKFEVVHSVGGSWHRCAAYGDMCACAGFARYGYDEMRSIPVSVQREVLCVPGPLFPDLGTGPYFDCECSASAHVLMKGNFLQARVKAANYLGTGSFSAPVSVKILGLPGPVELISVTEKASSVEVSWSYPEDSGFGIGGEISSILSYMILLKCAAGCVATSIEVSPSRCSVVGDQTQCAEDVSGSLLHAGQVYHVSVISQNSVGWSNSAAAPMQRLLWKISPTILSPTGQVRVATYAGKTIVWQGDARNDYFLLIVQHFPKLRDGQQIAFVVTGNGTSAIGSARLISRQVNGDGNLQDPWGLFVTSTFQVHPPANDGMIGLFAGRLLTNLEGKEVAMQLEYFQYPKASLITILADSGRLGGGEVVKIIVQEPTEPQTRFAASLPNFVLGVLDRNLGVVFGEMSAEILATKVEGSQVTLKVVAPQSKLAEQNSVLVSFFLAGSPIEVYNTSHSQFYTYRGSYIAGVTPFSGLTTGGQAVKLVISDLGEVSIDGLPEVRFGGQACTGVSFLISETGDFEILATTPNVDVAGVVEVSVHLKRKSAGSITLSEYGLFEFIVPPDPFLDQLSLTVDGRSGGEIFVFNRISAQVTFTLKHMYLLRTDPFIVKVGDVRYPSSAVIAAGSGDAADVQFAQTDFSLQTGNSLPLGNLAISVTARGFTLTGIMLQVRNAASPTIWGVVPSQSRMSGGSIVLAAVSGFSVMSAVSVDGKSAAVYGAVSLASWKKRDSEYQELVGNVGLSQYLAFAGPESVSARQRLVTSLENAVARSAGIILQSEAHLLFFVAPSATRAGRLDAAIEGMPFEFEYVNSPRGPSTISNLQPSSARLSGGVLLTLEIKNFLMVYFPHEIVVEVGQIRVDVESIGSSSDLRTLVSFMLPPSSSGPGLVDIKVHPTAMPENSARRSFTYVDDRLPLLTCVACGITPTSIYASGGADVTVVLTQYGTSATTKDDVKVVMLVGTRQYLITAGTIPAIKSHSFQNVAGEETSTIVFTAPGVWQPADATAWSATVMIWHIPTSRSVSTTIEYVRNPSGLAVLDMEPSQGPTRGGARIACRLTNFHQIDNSTLLTVTFDDVKLGADHIVSVASTTKETLIMLTLPSAFAGGTIPVTIYEKGKKSSAGTALFKYVDDNQMQVLSSSPPQGTSGSVVDMQVSLGNVGRVIASTADFVAGLSITSGGSVSITRIESSTPTASTITLHLILPTVQSSLSIRILISLFGGGDRKTVHIPFAVIPSGAPIILDFEPTSYPIDGGALLSVRLSRLPESIKQDEVQISIEALGTVNVTSLSVASGVTTLTARLPSAPSAGMYEMEVLILGGTISTKFPSKLSYTAPVDCVLVDIYPSKGTITVPTLVTLVVDHFPAIVSTSDIVVWAGGHAAIVTSYSQANPLLDPLSIQTVKITANFPYGKVDLQPGRVLVQVYHRRYASRAAISSSKTMFEYYNPELPNVESVVGENGRPEVKLSGGTIVRITVSKAPSVRGQADVVAKINGVDAIVQTLTNLGDQLVIAIVAPRSNQVQIVEGHLVFNGNFENSLPFTVAYFDDARASIVSISPSSGPDFGGTNVFIQLTNFPLVTDTNSVTVRFGLTGVYFGIVVDIVSSDVESTTLLVQAPTYPVAESSILAPVVVTHVQYSNRASSAYNFEFQKRRAEILSLAPSQATVMGGTNVYIKIAYFPVGLDNNAIAVEFGDVKVHPQNMTVTSSAVETTIMVVVTPASDPGVVRGRVYSKAAGRETAILFDFTFIDDSLPAIVAPSPVRGCIDTKGQTETIWVKLLPAEVDDPSQLSVIVEGIGDGKIKSLSQERGLTKLVLEMPETDFVGKVTVAVTSSFGVIGFEYMFVDCSVAMIEQVAPTSGVNSGGTKLIIRISNWVKLGLPVSVVSFMTVNGAVLSENKDGSAVILQVKTPVLDRIGLTDVRISGSLSSLVFAYEFLLPCNYDEFCSARGLVANVVKINRNPPQEPKFACDVTYCINPALLPYPTLIRANPSSGFTSGGTIVTVVGIGFPAIDLASFEAQVDDTVAGNPLAISHIGDGIIADQSQLIFSMPTSPRGAIVLNLKLVVHFGTVERSLMFRFQYIKALVGNAIVRNILPSASYFSQSQTCQVELRNFPHVEVSDTASITIQFASTSKTADRIIESTAGRTILTFTLPARSLTVGQHAVSIFYAPHKIARAGVVDISILSDPGPRIQGIPVPSEGLSSADNVPVELRAQHFGTGLSAGSFTVTLKSAGGILRTLTIESMTFDNKNCNDAVCSSVAFRFSIPSNPDGPNAQGSAELKLCTGSTCLSSFYRYTNGFIVELVEPSGAYSNQMTAARLYLKHFDLPFETIRVKLADTILEKDPVFIPTEENGIFSFGVIVPQNFEIGVKQGIVYVEDDATMMSGFKFTVLAPPTQVEPVDGTIEGGSLVTVTAFWGAMGTKRDASITFGGVRGEVQTLLMSNPVRSEFAIVTPPGIMAGIVEVELRGLGGAVTRFNFEYYDPPVFADVQPRVSTLDGRVGECSRCLLDLDGRHISVWVKNFPPVYFSTDLEVTIGPHKCDGSECAVKTIQNLVGELLFTVSVPAAHSTTRVAISVRHVGTPTPPHPAVTSSGNVRREEKTAVSSAVGIFLQYSKPLPVVYLAQFCSKCNAGSSCIDEGMCGMNEAPSIARATSVQDPVSIVLPQGGGGVLTLSVSELPDLLVSDGQVVGGTLSVAFGDRSGMIKRVLWSSVSETRFEVVPPEQSRSGRLAVTVTMLRGDGTQLQAVLSAVIVPDAISVRCTVSGSNLCAGPSDGARPLLLNFTDFPPVEQARLNSQVRVRIGLEIAAIQLMSSAGPHFTVFSVDVPPCTNCAFKNGVLSELLSIEIFSAPDKGWEVLTAVVFSYVAPPSVSSVRFSNAGSGLEVYFDSPTNRGGFKLSDVFSCDEVLAVVGLGTSPTCMWQNAQSLAVTFGKNPTVIPGDPLMLKPDVIKSLDGISPFVLSEQLRGQILGPTFPPLLGPVVIRGSSEIDTCANLVLSASAVSPRPLIFAWRCSTSDHLDAFLRSQAGSTVVLATGTPEMDQIDWQYVITVTATDFMGITSAITSHVVTKKRASMPQFTLSGMPSYQVSDDILLRVDAQFSRCPIAQSPLVFEWSDLSTGDRIPAYFFDNANEANIAHFFIPASTLKQGARYTVQIAASMMSEPYRKSTSVFDVFMQGALLLAVIDGGSVKTVSKLSHFSLDGTRSRDLGMVQSVPSFDGAVPAIDNGLTYKWSCSILSLPCRSEISGEILSFVKQRSIRVQAGTLAASMNIPYQFTLTVSKGTRAHSTVLALYVDPNPIPAIGISNHIAHVDHLGRAKINALDRLMLYGRSDDPDTTFSWSISPLVSLPVSVAPLGIAHKTLILVPSTSQPITVPGGTYVMKLEGTTPRGVGFAEITVVVNAPPQPGSCDVCKVLSNSGCSQTGRSLLDIFKIECSLWSDENQPLQYRYGLKSRGLDAWWSSLEFSDVKEVILPTGHVEITVEIVDSLGASAMSVPKTVVVSSFGRRLLAECSIYGPILDMVDSAVRLSRSDQINQFASALAHEMDIVGASPCTTVRSRLVSALEMGIAAAAITTDFAEEAGDTLSAVTSQPCGHTVDSALSSLALVKKLAVVNTRGRAIKTTLGKSLVNAISSSIGSSAAGRCSTPMIYTVDQAKMVMNLKVDAASLVMMASLRQKLVGEPAVEIQAEYTSQRAERTTLREASASTGGVRAQKRLLSVASGAAFILNSTIASQIGLKDASQAIDIFRSDDDLMEDLTRQLSAISFMSSVAVGLQISTAASTTHLTVQGLSTPIDVLIPVDHSKMARDSFWKQKVNCAWYDAVGGIWSFSGCERQGVSDSQIHCRCNHLTQFAIAIDPTIVICGDGQRTSGEECDDGNHVDNDGCSSSCTVEPGAFCDAQSPNVCLQACPPGQFLAGYSIQDARVIVKGTCTDCSALEYKPDAGSYATTCTPLTLCPAGRQKKWFPASLMGKTDGVCELCRKGFYKPSNPNGSPLDQCTRCPGFSITTVEGSDEERDCRCDGISRIQNPTSGIIDCIYADSCSMLPGPCVADATCFFSDACGTKCTCPGFHHGNGFTVGALVFDVFYGAITGTGCTVSGNNATAECLPGYFGIQCEYKMPIGTVFSHAVGDTDANGIVDPFSLQGFFNGVEVASINGPAGFLPMSYAGNTSIDISVLTREDLDLLNPGLAPDPSWMKSNLPPTDTRYVCAPTGSPLAADFILKLKPAGLTFAVPVQLGIDAGGVPDSDPPRYKHVMVFDEATKSWTPLGKGTLSDKVSASLKHFSLYASGAGAEIELPSPPPPPPPLPPGVDIISDPESTPTGNETEPLAVSPQSGISVGVLIAAIVAPFMLLMAISLFIFRKRIFGDVFVNKTAPGPNELGIMETPLINREASAYNEPVRLDATIITPDLPVADASSNRPPSAPFSVDLIAASGVKLNEWINCSACQVAMHKRCVRSMASILPTKPARHILLFFCFQTC